MVVIMKTIDGNWILEGLENSDPRRIKTSGELSAFINQIGFLPLFKNQVIGFSVEELTVASSWWADNPQEDPWQWREVIAGEGQIAYGKLFCNRAGFISKEWYPIFAAYRRNGYDFESRYEDGLASYRSKRIMDVMSEYEVLPSNEIKTIAGFGKGGEKGFEGVMSALQMQTYITVRSFQRRSNKKNEEYGWPVANFCLSERLFGETYVRSSYHLSEQEAKRRIIEHVKKHFPEAENAEIERVIK
jgi:hypothetical protein